MKSAHTAQRAYDTTSLLYATTSDIEREECTLHSPGAQVALFARWLALSPPARHTRDPPPSRLHRSPSRAAPATPGTHQARTHRAAQHASSRSSAPERRAPRGERTRRAQTRPGARRDLGRSSRPTGSRQIIGGSWADRRASHGGHYRPGWRRSKLPRVLAVLAPRCSLAAPPWLGWDEG